MTGAREARPSRARLADLRGDVTLLLFTNASDIEADRATALARQVVRDVAGMNAQIDVEEIDVGREPRQAASFRVSRTPAIAVLARGRDTRIRFLGASDGYEFASVVEAVALAGGSGASLSPRNRELIAEHVTSPLDIMVFVTPNCAACARVVQLAHRMAFEHALVRATCIDATHFPELSQLHRVVGVPTVIVNGANGLLGILPDDALVEAIVRPPSVEP